VLIRPARPDEYDDIGELAVRVSLAEGYTRTDSRYNAVLRDVAPRAEKAELMVAVDGAGTGTGTGTGPILGTVTYAGLGSPYAEHVSSPAEGSFRMLVVDPAARGRGVGEALVRWCIDRAAGSEVRWLRLSTLAGMTAAGRLYLRLGFVRTPERDWSPEPGVELITYGREIGAAVTPPGR
jgi:ribosomal protein S18 acetylase RimI-like enzyme